MTNEDQFMNYTHRAQGSGPPEAPARNWIKILAAYRHPSPVRSLFELTVTLVPILLLWGAAVWSTSVSYWLTF